MSDSKKSEDPIVIWRVVTIASFIKAYAPGLDIADKALIENPANETTLYGLKKSSLMRVADAFSAAIVISTKYASEPLKRTAIQSFITGVCISTKYPKSFQELNDFLNESFMVSNISDYLESLPLGNFKLMQEIENERKGSIAALFIVGMFCRCFYSMSRIMSSILSLNDGGYSNFYQPDWLPDPTKNEGLRAGVYWSLALRFLHASPNAYGTFIDDAFTFLTLAGEEEAGE